MSAEESSYDGIDSDDDVHNSSESPVVETERVIQLRKNFNKNLKLLLKDMDIKFPEKNINNKTNLTRIKDILKDIKSDGPQTVDRGQLISFVDE